MRVPLFVLFLTVLGLPFTLAAQQRQIETETMPLAEVKVGMIGEWATVVAGAETQRFGFKVVGIVPNFIGPKQPAILALATDASQILSGPVAGMSGSPCYIDGKLVGAYAYGFTWPKEQALIGITPIESMLKTLDKEDLRGDAVAKLQSGKSTPGPGWQARLDAWGSLDKTRALLAGSSEDALASSTPTQAMTPLPSPLFASGISTQALAPFTPALRELGLDPMAAPVGSAEGLGADSIAAGTALAGVLMDGDFNIAGVGTVTWREGDTFLAFGHPFFGTGDVEIPMAPAEVVTVVQSVQRSFKLSKVGDIVGSIRQDRLTAISGEIGRMAPTTPVHYTVHGLDGETRDYSGNLFKDRALSPLFAAIGLMESLQSTMELAKEQTLTLRAHYTIAGHEPFTMERMATGPGAPISLAIQQWLLMSLLMDNPFEDITVTAIDFDIEQRAGWDETTLEAVRKIDGVARPGQSWELGLTLARYLAPAIRESVTIPIPEGTAQERLTVFVGDGASADTIARGSSARTVTSLEGLLDFLKDSRSNDRAYVMLLRDAPGLSIDGQELPALPPSVRLLLDSDRERSPTQVSHWQTLWEGSLDVPGVFVGNEFVNLNVR